MTNEEFLFLIFNRLNLGTSGWHDDHNAYAHAKKLVAVAEAAKLIQPVECGMFGHNKKTFHKYDQDCPYVKQFNDAFDALERK